MRSGRRLRELRIAAGMTQADLAGNRVSHAYVSVIERGLREPSRDVYEYFAQRLGVAVEEIWEEAGTSWAVQMAEDLRASGQTEEGRMLLLRTLENLDKAKQVQPRVLVVLLRELALLEFPENPRSSRQHLERALQVAGDDPTLLAEVGEINAHLGELLLRDNKTREALERFRAAALSLLDVIRRSPRFMA